MQTEGSIQFRKGSVFMFMKVNTHSRYDVISDYMAPQLKKL